MNTDAVHFARPVFMGSGLAPSARPGMTAEVLEHHSLPERFITSFIS
jgi:hypothetical protein